MTDPTTTPGAMPPDLVNAIVRDMDDPRFPTQITVFCDHCGTTNTGDYMVHEAMTKTEHLAVARKHLVQNEGWESTEDGDDFCPEHASRAADEQTATLLVDRTSSTCGACGKSTLPSALTHADVSGYGPKPGGGCGARFIAIRSVNRGVTEEHLRSLRPDLPTAPAQEQQATDPPYSDADLRAEAALCLLALSVSPTVGDILRWLPGAYVDSHRKEDRSGHTWGDLLDNTGLADVARRIHGLISEAGNGVGGEHFARWAVDLGADGLEPTAHTVSLDSATLGGGFARLHLAFHPGVPEADRVRFTDGLRKAIEAHL